MAKLALPMNNGVFPRNAKELRELGVAYSNCFPSPEARLLRAFEAQIAEARNLLK